MRSSVTPELANALKNRLTRPCLLYDYDHPAGRLRLWSGFGTISWDGFDWKQAGVLLQVSAIEQTTELQVSKVQFVLSGVVLSAEALALVLQPARRAPIVLYRAFLDREFNVIRDPVVWFRGYGDPPSLQDMKDGTHTVTVPASGALFNLIKPRRTLLSHNEQQARFPGDTGLRFMGQVAQQQKEWTIGAYNNFSPP